MMSNKHTGVEFFIKGTDCDINDDILLNNLFGYMQESADISSKEMGLDALYLNQHNWCWLIISNALEITRLPRWRETIRIETWSTGIDKFFFGREYEIYNQNDEILCKASSVWIIADMISHHPVIPSRYKELSFDSFVMDDKKAMGYQYPARIKATDIKEISTEPILTKFADYSELDRNHHVNNTRYLAWFEDALHLEGIDIRDVNNLSVYYMAEIKPGTKVNIYLVKSNNDIRVYGYDEQGTSSFEIVCQIK